MRTTLLSKSQNFWERHSTALIETPIRIVVIIIVSLLVRAVLRRMIDRAVRPIGGCITHEQANLRKEAAAALGEIADPSGEPFLALVAGDTDPEVRKNSRWALQQIAARKARAGA